MTKISAIDLGFMYTKAIIDGKPVMIKSLAGDSRKLRFEDLDMSGNTEHDRLKSTVGMETFFVSDLALQESDVIHHSLKDNRFDSTVTEVLVKTVFALGLGNDHTHSNIVSGLPASHYETYKEDIKSLFMGSGTKIHNYDVEENKTKLKGSVEITDGKFIPQPFGAFLDRVLDDEGQVSDKALAGKTVAVIDPGFGTTDIYVVNTLKPVDRLSFSTPTAMNHAYRLISNKISEKFDDYLPLHSIESIVRNGVFRESGKVYPMQDIVKWSYKNTAQQLIAEVTNKWNSSIKEIDYILLAGGGGLALSNYILPEFPNIELLSNSQWSVVNGYYKWGVRHFD